MHAAQRTITEALRAQEHDGLSDTACKFGTPEYKALEANTYKLNYTNNQKPLTPKRMA